MKILMIGNKESGKTTYMASSFGIMNNGVCGFYIQTDDSTQNWFNRLFREISCGGYPDATDKRGSYEFTLYYNQKRVIDFQWIDYNGGVITDTSIEKLDKDIDEADGMMVFLDSEALLKNDVSTHRFRRIIALISSKLEKGDCPLFSLIIVLTKYDKIPSSVSIEKITKPIQTFIDNANENEKLYVRVVPVSCTSNGFFNVDLPLLDILDSSLKIAYLSSGYEANSYYEMAADKQSHVGILDWGISRLFGLKTNGELASEYKTIADEKYELFKSLEEPVENLAQYVADYKIVYPNIQINNRVDKVSKKRRFIEL